MNNQTLAIIKPDAIQAGNTGKIIDRIIGGGFRIRAMKIIRQTRTQAEGFYEVHRGKPFYEGLTEFMSSGPCIVMVLEKEGAAKNSDRQLVRTLRTARIRTKMLRSRLPISSVNSKLSSVVSCQ
jgi:nucleoside diphosphate kinase